MGFFFSLSTTISFLFLIISPSPSHSHGVELACRSSCGKTHNIANPFRFQGDPDSCGELEFELICTENQTIVVFNSRKYLVEEINYDGGTIRILDPGVLDNNCAYMPSYFSDDTPLKGYFWPNTDSSLAFVKCLTKVNDSNYVAMPPCHRNGSLGNSHGFMYALVGFSVGNFRDSCSVVNGYSVNYIEDYLFLKENIVDYQDINLTYKNVEDIIQYGIVLSWFDFYSTFSCSSPFHSRHCFANFLSRAVPGMLAIFKILGYIILGRTIIGVLLYILFLIYMFRKRNRALDEKLEIFLTENKNRMPTRYSYKEILRITDDLKEKLGQGGFGSVYKGKLRNENFVAVKMLDKSKRNNGQDFVNEVATIGRIHHVNVVNLLGFCAEGSIRSLVYEYMPNGSLEKYLSSGERNHNELNWRKLHEISLGISRGIEYLHRGCSMKILHFDIKPHNILLDDKFTPKVSDFGLAKFYPTESSIVSLTNIRGTIGYIAPELFYRKVVSYKSDVYSYGMLLMEMVGKRRNFDRRVENSSQIYLPSWIYDKLVLEKDFGEILDENNMNSDEKDTAKKLALVALWCIQINPSDRPSMSKVVEMLEGSLEELEMPKRPFMSSSEWNDEENNREIDDNNQSNPLLDHSMITIVSAR